MCEHVQTVHDEAQFRAEVVGGRVEFAGLRATPNAQEALLQRAVFVLAAQTAEQAARTIGQAPCPPDEPERRGGLDPSGGEVLEHLALERAALRGALRVDPAGAIRAQRRARLR